MSHDRDLVGYKGITWVDQPRVVARNTDYTFERDKRNELSNNSYYVFYVGHREDKLKDVISLKYGSKPYFFGQQSELLHTKKQYCRLKLSTVDLTIIINAIFLCI